MVYRLTTALLALCVVTSTVAAELQTGRVVHVVDGGALIVLVGETRLNVRLEHIEAPQRGQAYAHRSRQSLIAICGGELATIDSMGKDRNRRMLARVTCNGVDAGKDQVRRGMARVSEQYAPADSPLHAIQKEAQSAHRGLWVDADRHSGPRSSAK